MSYDFIPNAKLVESLDDLKHIKSNEPFKFVCVKCGKTEYRVHHYSTTDTKRFAEILCEKCYKIKNNREKYGVDYYCLTDEFKKESLESKIKRSNGRLTVTGKPDYNNSIKASETYKAKTGYDNAMHNPEAVAKLRQTIASRTDEENAIISSKTKQTKLENHGDPNYNNREQAAETNLKLFGYKYASQNPDIAKKMSESRLNKSPEEKQAITDKINAKNQMKFGSDWYLGTPECLAKTREYYQALYGVDNYQQTELARQQARENHKYGIMTSKYTYYGIKFGSKWELAIWIYAKDHSEFIIHEPMIFPFVDAKGSLHSYYPDFWYKGKLLEIKGDQFFRPDGTMYCPYRYDYQTDEEYEFICDIYERKHQCGLEHGVEFWKEKDVEPYLRYMDETYGNNWEYAYKNILKTGKNELIAEREGYSYPVFHGKGISPYDSKPDTDGFVVANKGVSPYDIK